MEHFQVWVLAMASCKLFFPCPSHLSLHLHSDSPAIRGSLRKWLIQNPPYRKTLLLSLYLLEGTAARAPSSISLQSGDQVQWSVLRSSKILCGTGCGPKLPDYSHQCEVRQCISPVVWLESVTVLYLQRLSRKAPIPEATVILFQGRLKVLSLEDQNP